MDECTFCNEFLCRSHWRDPSDVSADSDADSESTMTEQGLPAPVGNHSVEPEYFLLLCVKKPLSATSFC